MSVVHVMQLIGKLGVETLERAHRSDDGERLARQLPHCAPLRTRLFASCAGRRRPTSCVSSSCRRSCRPALPRCAHRCAPSAPARSIGPSSIAVASRCSMCSIDAASASSTPPALRNTGPLRAASRERPAVTNSADTLAERFACSRSSATSAVRPLWSMTLTAMRSVVAAAERQHTGVLRAQMAAIDHTQPRLHRRMEHKRLVRRQRHNGNAVVADRRADEVWRERRSCHRDAARRCRKERTHRRRHGALQSADVPDGDAAVGRHCEQIVAPRRLERHHRRVEHQRRHQHAALARAQQQRAIFTAQRYPARSARNMRDALRQTRRPLHLRAEHALHRRRRRATARSDNLGVDQQLLVGTGAHLSHNALRRRRTATARQPKRLRRRCRSRRCRHRGAKVGQLMRRRSLVDRRTLALCRGGGSSSSSRRRRGNAIRCARRDDNRRPGDRSRCTCRRHGPNERCGGERLRKRRVGRCARQLRHCRAHLPRRCSRPRQTRA
jgi:hypothetical protein